MDEIMTLDDLITTNNLLYAEIKKIPEDRFKSFRTMSNMYILECLSGKDKLSTKQKKSLEVYMNKLSKEYSISGSYVKQLFNLMDTYYNKHENRETYKRGL